MTDQTPQTFFKNSDGTFVNTDFADASLKGGKVYSAADAGVAAAPAASPTRTYVGQDGKTYSENGSTPGLTDRYASDRSSIDNTFSTPAPNETAIRDNYRQNAQSAVNAINTKFATIEAQDRQTVDLMNRERRASNVLGGLSGSTTGAARTIDTSNKGKALIDRDAAQKQAEIDAVFSNAEVRGTEEFNRQRTEYIANQKDKYTAEQALATKIHDTALNEIATLASGAKSFDELKTSNPAILSQYEKETGMDETTLKAYFLTKVPKTALVSDKPEILGNKAIFFQKMPDGSVKQVSIDLPAGSSKIKETRITDGGVQVLYEDGTYKTIGTPGNTTRPPVGDAISNAQSLTAGALNTVRGSDGYVSPEDYKKAKNAWISAGYADDYFDKNFASYINPAYTKDYTGASTKTSSSSSGGA